MGVRIFAAMVLFVIPIEAEPGLFYRIRNKDTVALVLPGGECEAKVVRRELDQLTLRLKKTTGACGAEKALVRLSFQDVEDVSDNRRPTSSSWVWPKVCSAAGLVLGAYAGGAVVVKLKIESLAPVLPFMAAGGIGGALLCRDRGSGYSVFSRRVLVVVPAKEKGQAGGLPHVN